MRSRLRSWLLTPAGRPRTPWRLVLAAVLFVLASVSVSALFLLAGAPSGAAPGSGGHSLTTGLLLFVATGIAMSAAVVLAARYVDDRTLSDLGVALDGTWWSDLSVGAGLGVVLTGGAFLGGAGLGVYEFRFAPAGPSGRPLVVWIVLLVAAMVAVGVYEELLVRGYALTNLAEGFTAVLGRRGATTGAVAVTGLGFGALHAGNPNATALSVLTVTLAGVMLGLGYVLTGSIALPIGLHVTWNLTHALLGLPVSGLDIGVYVLETEPVGPAYVHGGQFGPEGGLLGVAAVLTGCILIAGYARLTGRTLEAAIATPSLRGEAATAQRADTET